MTIGYYLPVYPTTPYSSGFDVKYDITYFSLGIHKETGYIKTEIPFRNFSVSKATITGSGQSDIGFYNQELLKYWAFEPNALLSVGSSNDQPKFPLPITEDDVVDIDNVITVND